MSGLISENCVNSVVSLLVKYDEWLIGEDVKPSSRNVYLKIARKVVDRLSVPGQTVDDLKARVASLTKDELLVIKEKVCWTSKDGKRRLKQNSASTNCTSLNSFLRFAGCSNRVKVPPRRNTVKIPLSIQESEALLRAAGQYTHPQMAARNKAIVCLLQEGALRRGSFNVLLEDLRLDEGYAVIRDTKNGDDLKVPLAWTAVEAIQEYLLVRPRGKNAEADRYTFISQRGTALGNDRVYHVIKECAAKAGIARNIWPHLLRHTKLTDLNRRHVSAFDIKDFAGHKSIKSTEPYIHTDDQEHHATIVSASLFSPRESGPTVRIDDGRGGSDPLVLLTIQLAEGKIDAETYNKAIANLAGTVMAR